MFPLHSIPLLTTVYKRLETEESSCWMFGNVVPLLPHRGSELLHRSSLLYFWILGFQLVTVFPKWFVPIGPFGGTLLVPRPYVWQLGPLVLVASPLYGHVQKHVLLVVVSEMLSTNRAAAPPSARDRKFKVAQMSSALTRRFCCTWFRK